VPRFGGLGCNDAREITLADLDFRINERFLYDYDFCDLWQHQVRIEKRLEIKNDVRYLHQLQQRLSTQLGEAKLVTVFRLETALLPIIAHMETSGFAIDAARMRSLRQEADARAASLLPDIRSSFSSNKLNPGSPKQIVEAFNANYHQRNKGKPESTYVERALRAGLSATVDLLHHAAQCKKQPVLSKDTLKHSVNAYIQYYRRPESTGYCRHLCSYLGLESA
jgi:pRiA4b ORF-3-like protein